MRVIDRIKKILSADIIELKGKIQSKEEKLHDLDKNLMLKSIDNVLKDEEVVVSFRSYMYSTPTLEIKTASIVDTRRIATKLLEIEEIKEFKKLFVSYDADKKTIKWKEEAETDEMVIDIFPAEPSNECQLVRRENSYTTWSCEKIIND